MAHQLSVCGGGDRTFFVAESRPGLCPADRFVEFGVTGTGVPAGLRQVGVDASGMLGGLAASPDGTRLAYVTDCSTPANPGPTLLLQVIDLASGAVSTWTADGGSLSFGNQWRPSQPGYPDEAVVLVNVGGGSGTLQAHSRLLWHQSARCWPGSCVPQRLDQPGPEVPAGRGVRTKTAAGIVEPPAWTDSSGTYWLLAVGNQLG